MLDAGTICKRQSTMESDRMESVETVWRECFDYTFPLRGNGIQGSVESANSAQAKQADLCDGTAADSALVLAANMMAGLTPANARWFGFDAGNESHDEKAWLDAAADLLWQNIHNSNFDAEAFEGCLDIVAAGQFALYIDEDREAGGLTFQQWPLAQVYTTSTRSDGVTDVVHRKFELSAEAAANEYGIDNLPEQIRKALEKQPEKKFNFIHAIYPRKTYAVGAKLAKNLPIASCHVCADTKTIVRESGYHEMPVVVPRWMRIPGSFYAVGPMYAALPDVKLINEMKALELAGADIAVSGMWIGVDDGVLNPRTVKIGPRKVIVAADADNFRELRSGANFQLSDMLVTRLQGAIRKALMADQLQPQDGPQMTATEVHVRVEMIRKLLGPIYGRLQAEYLRPMVDRCFGLAYRAGIFVPPPESLRGREFSVRYESPLSRAQRMDDVMAIESVFAAAGQLAMIDPSVIDELDASESLRLIAEGRGAPVGVRRRPEDVAKLREERAKAQAQQQQQQLMAQGAEAAAVAGGTAMGQQMAGVV